MLIAIEVAHANKDNRTGVENVCWHLIEELKKIIPSSTRVVLYSNKPLSGELAKMPNSNWSVEILKWPFGKGWSQFRLSWEFLFNKPDIFLAPGQLVPFISPINTISVVHDSAFRALPKIYWWGSRWYLRFMNWLLSKKSKIIITPSQFSKQEFLKYYKFDEKNVKIVQWGYDKEFFNFKFLICFTPFKKCKQFQISNFQIKKPYLLSIGRLEEKKNIVNIIKAFNLLKNQNLKSQISNLKLVLVGSPGVGYTKIKQAIDSSPYKSDIITPGYVKSSDLLILLKNAVVFVFPSLYEGFGLPILEAMACGTPVVASCGNCLEEVGGEAIEYVDWDDYKAMSQKIEQILLSPDLRDKLIEQGLRQADKFSWQRSGQEVYRFIKELI